MSGEPGAGDPALTGRGGGLETRKLFDLVYKELRALAERQLAGERPDHTLQPTALVHEVYLRLAGPGREPCVDRNHFLALAAEAMRCILVDHARRRGAKKRGGDRKKQMLDSSIQLSTGPDTTVDLVDFGDALDRLSQLHERMRRVVELRLFGGLAHEEVADVLGVSRNTVANDWAFARSWLRAELSAESDPA